MPVATEIPALSVAQKCECPLAAEAVKYRLITTLPGVGYKGDAVKIIRTMGILSMVSNGQKTFVIEKNNLSLCPLQQQAPAK